ncbi:hypothetical protein [Streptomyces bobili]|uniref:hypothetical protein n=1 Tax=Streptomyces bobili TaxID=67280 RepID=UPI0037169B75
MDERVPTARVSPVGDAAERDAGETVTAAGSAAATVLSYSAFAFSGSSPCAMALSYLAWALARALVGLLLGLLTAVLSVSLGLLHQLVDVVLGTVVGKLRLKGLAP